MLLILLVKPPLLYPYAGNLAALNLAPQYPEIVTSDKYRLTVNWPFYVHTTTWQKKKRLKVTFI